MAIIIQFLVGKNEHVQKSIMKIFDNESHYPGLCCYNVSLKEHMKWVPLVKGSTLQHTLKTG